MTFESIYIDLDDTLNSFTMRVLQYFGVKCGPYDFDKYPKEAGFDIIKAVHLLTGRYYDKEGFWNAIPRRVWYTCPRSREFDLILDWAQAHAPRDQIYILTAPTKDPECLAGKLDWIVDNLPSWLHRQYFITPRKHKLARPGRVLIDDCLANVTGWAEHEGTSVIVPRPWNLAPPGGLENRLNYLSI